MSLLRRSRTRSRWSRIPWPLIVARWRSLARHVFGPFSRRGHSFSTLRPISRGRRRSLTWPTSRTSMIRVTRRGRSSTARPTTRFVTRRGWRMFVITTRWRLGVSRPVVGIHVSSGGLGQRKGWRRTGPTVWEAVGRLGAPLFAAASSIHFFVHRMASPSVPWMWGWLWRRCMRVTFFRRVMRRRTFRLGTNPFLDNIRRSNMTFVRKSFISVAVWRMFFFWWRSHWNIWGNHTLFLFNMCWFGFEAFGIYRRKTGIFEFRLFWILLTQVWRFGTSSFGRCGLKFRFGFRWYGLSV